jgi:hypothetical protein
VTSACVPQATRTSFRHQAAKDRLIAVTVLAQNDADVLRSRNSVKRQ